MAAKAKPKVQVYRSLHTFSTGEHLVRAGDSVAAGHPLLKGREHLFEPFQPTHGTIAWGDDEPEGGEA